MSNAYQQLSFAEIKHKLPKDCWAYSYNEAKGELENEQVLYFSGDTQLSHLNLDDVPGLPEKDEADFPFLVLVEGNLTIDNYIYNEDTDGATGLIVLGNLKARNIVVGGQQLYISGNLEVTELFWGDYNHGNLKVAGAIAAYTFIATDYRFDHDRFRRKDRVAVTNWIWDEQDILDNAALTELLDEECLILDDDDDPIIYRKKMLEHFEQGLPVIKIVASEPIPFVFESRDFDKVNLTRLRHSPLFLDGIPADAEDRSQTIEYWRGNDFKRVIVIKDRPWSERVYFQREDKAIIYGYMPMEEDNGFPYFRFTAYVRTASPEMEDSEIDALWEPYNLQLPEHRPFHQMGEALWAQLLDEWSEIEYWQQKFSQVITREKIEQILALPMVKSQYSNYNNYDAEDLWEGFYCWRFRQGNDAKDVAPRIAILKQLEPGSGDKDDDALDDAFDFYLFDVRKQPNGNMAAVLYTQDGNGNEYPVYKVPVDHIEKYRNAIRYFEMLERNIYRLNKEHTREQQGKLNDEIDALQGIDESTKSLIKNITGSSYEALMAEQAAAIDTQPDTNEPFLFQGHLFTCISPRQARTILSAIPHEGSNLWESQWLNPEPEYAWLLAEGDLTMDTLMLNGDDFDQLAIGGIIVRGNLQVKYYIDGSLECVPLCVLGNLTTAVACFSFTSHFITGDLQADLLLGSANDGYLVVKGDVKSKVICTDGYPVHVSGNLFASLVLDDSLHVKNVNIAPSKLSRTDIFIEEVLYRTVTHDLDYDGICQYTQEGRSVLLKEL